MTAGELIRKNRKAQGLSMAELGNRIGVTAAAISRYELGQRELTIDTLQAIASALNLHILEFFGVTDEVVKQSGQFEVELSTGETVPPSDARVPGYLKKVLTEDPRKLYDDLSYSDKMEVLEIIRQSEKMDISWEVASNQDRLNVALGQMSDEGKSKVADYAEDILPRYRRPNVPQSTPALSKGHNSTTPAPDAQKAPSEGE